MNYYFSARVYGPFDEVVERATEALKEEGFGIISKIDVQETFRKKLDIDYPPYLILGACNPQLAHAALELENKVGTMLPCNVVVREEDGAVEVAAIDPVASMQSIENAELSEKASEVATRLKRAVESLKGSAP